MNKTVTAVLLAVAVLAALTGCLSTGGKPRGPVDAFVFGAGANPGLPQDAPGSLNMRSDPLEIIVVVPPGTDKRRLVATFSLNTEATITVISSGERVVQQNGATPNDFTAPVLYGIEVVKEKKPWRYRVTVREAETNARLAQLSFPEGSTLTPAFSPQVKRYTVVVPYATRQLSIGARAESQFLKSVTFDGAAGGGASASGRVDFSAGQERTVLIETLAEDGVSSDRYTVLVRRGEPDRNSLLASLEAVEGTLAPAFTPQRTEYSLQVPFTAARVALRAKPQSGLASVSLSTISDSGDAQERAALEPQGSLANAQGASVAFTGVDWLPLIVTVTAEDGSKRDYLVEVARAEPDHNNALAALTVNGATLSPAFAPGTRSYVVRMPYAARQAAVTAKPQSELASAQLELSSVPQGTPAPQGSLGAAEGAVVAYPEGVDRMGLAVAVTAQDGRILRYTLDLRRQPAERNADLKSLVPAAGTLTPAFSSRVVSYTLRLPAAAESAAFTLSTAGAQAKLRVEPPAVLEGASLRVPVAPGQTLPLGILVVAEDGTQRLYQVNIVREGSSSAPAQPQPGSSRLAQLQLGSAPLLPPFDPAVTAYEVKVPAAAATLLLTARPENPSATVSLNGQPLPASGLAVWINQQAGFTLTLEVKSETGAVTRYSLRLVRDTAFQPPASAGALVVAAKNLRLGDREAAALASQQETIGAQALITVRVYRSGEVLAQVPAAVSARVQGSNRMIRLEQSLGQLPAAAGKLVEVETSIPTSGGRYLCYTEALRLDSEDSLEIPFLLLKDNPRLAWPAVGSPTAVSGYRSLLPAGRALGGRDELPRNDRGDTPVVVEIADAKSGTLVSRETVLVNPSSGRQFAFGRPLQLREGAQVAYRLSVKALNGKIWQASGQAEVWTTAPAYEGGFAPVLLPLADELRQS